MGSYALKDIIEKTKKAGGSIWETPYYLNIIGVRDISSPNSWNDTLIYFYWDDKKNLHIVEINEFTTDPGIISLTNPVSAAGCAILKEGWHRRLWVKGKHQGKYAALVQTTATYVYRDNNKDAALNLDPKTLQLGIFGINLHRANQNSIAAVVGPHSAGCQVLRLIKDFDAFMLCVDQAIKHGQTFFSYMLFNKNEF